MNESSCINHTEKFGSHSRLCQTAHMKLTTDHANVKRLEIGHTVFR